MSFKRRLNSGTHQSYQVLSHSNITRSKHYQNYNYYYYYYGGHQESEGWTQDHTRWMGCGHLPPPRSFAPRSLAPAVICPFP